MNIVETYDLLRRRGHVIDQYAFDRNWLGRQPGYLAYLKSTQAQPTVETLMRLYLRLLKNEQFAARYGVGTDELQELANQILEEVKQRCL